MFLANIVIFNFIVLIFLVFKVFAILEVLKIFGFPALSHTCGVYYPCDKPLLYHTGDAISNTSGRNYF